MDARPSHADAKPSASYRDKSGICNLCRYRTMMQVPAGIMETTRLSTSTRPGS
jgi:hypothetical protein